MGATGRLSAMEREMTVVDLAELAASGGSGAIFARETADLDLNLVRFAPGSGVGEHVNREVDVAVIVLDGEGVQIGRAHV